MEQRQKRLAIAVVSPPPLGTNRIEETNTDARTLPRLAKGQRTNAGDLPIDHTGELINDDLGRLFADDPGKLCPELLAIGQHMEGPQPGGHRAQPDCRKRRRHIIKGTLRRDGLNDRLIVRPCRLIPPIA